MDDVRPKGSESPGEGESKPSTVTKTVLTEEDRERVRHETILRAEVRREVENALVAKLGLFGKLNSKVALTSLTGVFVALISVLVGGYAQRLQRDAYGLEKQAAIERENREKKVNTIATFDSEFETSLSLMGTHRRMAIWLTDHKATDPQEATDYYGRSRKEVEPEAFDVWKLYIQHRKVSSEIDDVKNFFDDQEVKRLAGKLGEAVEMMDAAEAEPDLLKLYREAEHLEDALVSAMRTEVQRSTNRPPSGEARPGPN